MSSSSSLLKTAPSRILALDYLRGFFIIVIIVDHLWRWPNIFEFISGRGELWVSAAEGFVIISGLLVGYIRGYKDRNKPLLVTSKKLVLRGLTLYLWMLITTFLLVSASWLLPFKGGIPPVPIDIGHWNELFISMIRLDYAHTLTHFLYLYAIFLILSPFVIWLLRRGFAWIVAIISVIAWFIGMNNSTEWMQWQLLFFLPAIGGFYFESLLTRYHTLSSKTRKMIRFGSIGITLIMMTISAIIILPYPPAEYVDTLFSRNPVMFLAIVAAFVWFVGLLSLFQYILPFLQRWFGWLLQTFGERSLTAYIVHVIPLVLCQMLFVDFTNFWLNSLLTAACILATWALLKIPHINKVIPR
jgi:peptidoglycan/LPS O-acetylase OafA/YrhL